MNCRLKVIYPRIKAIFDKVKGICDTLHKGCQYHVRNQYANLRLIFCGSALAIVCLTVPFRYPNNIGFGHMFMRLARWFEWVFATVLMTTITVIVSMQYLKGSAQVLLLIGLLIFFVATLISQFDQAGWFGRKGGR
jgi:hypothetical protein